MIAGVHAVRLPMSEGTVADVRDFYVGVLGMAELDPRGADPQEFDRHEVGAGGGLRLRAGGAELQLHVAEPAETPPVSPALEVDDVDAAVAALHAAGVRVLRDAGNGNVLVDDPAGNRIELVQLQRPALAPPVTEVFVAAGAVLVGLLDGIERSAWDEPSALDHYTVGGLAAHAARAIETVERYLAAPEPPSDVAVVDAGSYFAEVLGDHDPHDSAVHVAIRERASSAAMRGAAAVAADAGDALGRLRAALPAVRGDRLVTVRDGIATTVDEYLRTRVVELVVHVDDLLASAALDGLAAPPMPDDAWTVAAEVLAATAVRRVGGPETVRSLARAERHPAAVRAL